MILHLIVLHITGVLVAGGMLFTITNDFSPSEGIRQTGEQVGEQCSDNRKARC